MTKLSPDDKYTPDGSLERLLDLNGEVMEMGGGYWVKIVAQKVEPSEAKPHGIDYSLCLFSPDDERLICFDNAHPVRKKGFARQKVAPANDHMHTGEVVEVYPYVDAEGLMHDFWEAVDQTLAAKGV